MAELSTRKDSAGDTPADKATDDAATKPAVAANGAPADADGAAAGDPTAAEQPKVADAPDVDESKAADSPEATAAEPKAAEPKAAEPKAAEPKAAEPKGAATAPEATKPTATRADAAKAVQPKPVEPKPEAAKPADTKTPDTKTPDTKTPDTKTPDTAPAATADPLTGSVTVTGAAGKDTGKDTGTGSGGVSDEALSAAAATYAKPAKVKKQRSKPPALVLALSSLLVLLVIGAGVLGWHQYQAAQARDDRALALQTARDVASNLTTITSDNFTGQIDALSKISTSGFKEQMTGYSAMFGALLKQGNVALRGTVTSAGMEKLEGDSAAALITVSTLITSGQQPQGVPQSFGLLVSLQRDGDRWLASNVDFLR